MASELPPPSPELQAYVHDEGPQPTVRTGGLPAPSQALTEFAAPQLKQDQYGGMGSQALAGFEGAGQGYLGPVFTAAERAASEAGVPGLTPEDQAARAEVNPGTHAAGVGLGLGAGALTGTGELGLVGEAAEAAGQAANLGRVGTLAVRGAVGAGLIQGGDELSKAINADPQQTAVTALTNIGLASVLGGSFEAGMGTLFPKWWGPAKEEAEQGIQDFKNTMNGSVTDQASQEPLETLAAAPPQRSSEIAKIGAEQSWPVLEGMTTDAKDVQWAERALLEGAPTIAARARRAAYQDAFDRVSSSVDAATASNSPLSETQVGNVLKQSILDNLKREYAPIQQLYDEIEPYRQAIPLSDRSSGALSRTIGKIIEDQGLVPGSERHNFIKTFADGIENVDNLQKLANFRTEVNRSAGPLTKDLAGAIGDKLDGVEERAIRRFAETMKTDPAQQKILGLVDQADAAKKGYSAFREKLSTLGNAIGKKKIYGPQNFMDFLEDLNPQALTRRLFSENNTEFAQYFAKEFPSEMGVMRSYQRAQIRDAAMRNGIFDPKLAIKNILKMEPETRSLLFSPEEAKTLTAAEKYLNAFPKAFNISNTDNMREIRQFFESPTGAAIANLKDAGILAFIKAMGRVTPGAEAEAERMLPILGKRVLDKEPSAEGLKSATGLILNSIKGDQSMTRVVRGLVSGAIPEIKNALDQDRIAKLDKRVKDFQDNPDLLQAVGGRTGHYLPDHDLAMKAMAANAAGYLNQIRPKAQKPGPLDAEIEPADSDVRAYHRALQIAQQPLHVLKLAADGRLTAEDVTHFQNLYPAASKVVARKLNDAVTAAVSKKQMPPYHIRRALGLLTGQNYDSGLSGQSVAGNQSMFSAAPMPGGLPKKIGGVKKSPQGGLKQLSLAERTGLSSGSDES